jgi:hypothetical protein
MEQSSIRNVTNRGDHPWSVFTVMTDQAWIYVDFIEIG